MRPLAIEAWALRILERIEAGGPREDARVELKTEWIPPNKAARLIAAHANTAAPDPVLWLIGVDEKTGIVGAAETELATWRAQVGSFFDGVAPTITPVAVPTEQGTVMALLFDTSRAPFVVKTGATGGVEREVPWRDGNRTRSALRSDLLRLLVPRQDEPDIELVSAHAHSGIEHIGPLIDDYGLIFRFRFELYVTPRSSQPITIPRHRCGISMQLGGKHVEAVSKVQLLPPLAGQTDLEKSIEAFRFAGPEDEQLLPSVSVAATRFEAVVTGPGFLIVQVNAQTSTQVNQAEVLSTVLTLRPAMSDSALVTQAVFRFTGTAGNLRFWDLSLPQQ